MSLRRNSLANIISAGTRFVAALLTTPLLIRVLGVEGYGVWVVLTSAVSLSTLAEFGLCSALSVYLASAQQSGDKDASATTLGTTLMLLTSVGVIVSALWFFSVPLMVSLLFPAAHNSPELLTALRVLGLVVLPRMWQSWLVSWEMGLLRYDLSAQAETANLVGLNLGTVLLAWTGYGLVAFAAWQVAITLLTVVHHVWLLKRAKAVVGWRWSRMQAKVMVHFGMLQWFSSIGQVLFARADRLIVNAALGPGAAGLYAAAVSIASKINELSAVPVQPLTQTISQLQAAGDEAGIRRTFEWAISANAVVIYALTATIFWTVPWLGALMVPERAEEFNYLSKILALVYAGYSFGGVGYYAVLGLKLPKAASYSVLIGAASTLGLMWYVAPRLGLKAAAWSNIGYLVICAMNLIAGVRIGLTVKQLLSRYVPVLVSLTICMSLASLLAICDRSALLTTAGWAASMLLCFWIDPKDAVELWRMARLRTLKIREL